MKHQSISIISLALVCATAGFPQITLNQVPSRIVGHPNAEQLAVASSNPNLVEGREFYSPQGIALDTSVTPPYVYVSDAGNNRVLAWKSATGFRNGDPADLVIGQRDKFTTNPQGPFQNGLQTGLYNPTGLAVHIGDLWVVDSGNNRLLRYPTPFQHSDQFPDLVIGQTSLNGRSQNFSGAIDTKGIYLNTISNNNPVPGSIAFDNQNSNGNLWFTDAGNRRVLRFRFTDINAKVNGPAADLVIGQRDPFTVTVLNPNTPTSQQPRDILAVPNAIAFDTKGRLYISDSDFGSINRVAVFDATLHPLASGMQADRYMGVIEPPLAGQTIDESQKGKTLMGPGGIFFLPGTQGLGVLDTASSRILIFDPYESWPPQNTQFSPQARTVFGQQGSITLRTVNSGKPRPSESTLANPVAATYFTNTNELYIADSNNNRVIVIPFQNGSFTSATRVLGQDRFDTNSINLIEGREFQFNGSGSSDAAIAIDSTGDVPHLYVSDPYNNRVLGFRDARKVAAGIKADIVIGQPDLQTALCNYPSGSGVNTQPTQSSLCVPIGIVVDSSGNLYVADTLNGRVLRFPAPFSHPGQQQADLVLGQQDFTSPSITDPSARTMSRPYGLAIAGPAITPIGLLVSDVALNRVLFFPFTSNGTFIAGTDNGKSATKVFGQLEFSAKDPGVDDTRMNGPRHIAADTSAQFYVTDPGNNRILIFDQVLNNQDKGAHAALPLPNLQSPQGIFVSQRTGEIWYTETGGRLAVRCPRFDALVIGGAAACTTRIPAANATLAVAQDQFDDLFVADASNRIGIYFPGLATLNGASFLNRSLAPGMVASLFPLSATNQFGKDTANFNELPNPLPLPKTLADIQVLFNGQPAPLYYVAPGQLNFLVPMSAPTTGTADLTVIHPSTGQILAAGLVSMNSSSPGIFAFGTLAKPGTTPPVPAQAAALNQDNTTNSPTNAAARGSVIQIFATGQGFVPGAPPDGEAPSGTINTPTKPRVFIAPVFVDDPAATAEEGDHIPYSGLAPGLVGVWQINVQIPMKVPPGAQVPILILMNSLPNSDAQSGFMMTIAVK
jgi:uncharacterized protein (TIGR03437 family)